MPADPDPPATGMTVASSGTGSVDGVFGSVMDGQLLWSGWWSRPDGRGG
ncbi:hypothetical protein ACFFX0_05340 [Citricoccus parietis]|uniref:Uncharacterized protein n=1 Tax=Citricoccus parietis TaxID=592307 RepID=A0ABV5FVI1_9MICC